MNKINKLFGLILQTHSPLGKLNLPPNTCMPSSEKITMNRKSRSRRLAIARIELIREATRFRKDVQYLRRVKKLEKSFNRLKI